MNKKVVIQIILVVLVLLAGFVFFKILASMRKPPVKKPQLTSAPLLNALTVKAENIQVVIPGFGTVQPKVEVTIIPQVAGKIIECHDDFVNGGFFKAGEPLIVIEPNDYALAAEQAKVAYEKELAEHKVALLEWDQIHPDETPTSPLVTRELQLKAAEANFKIAQLALERTTIAMPFSGRVAEESVDLGQYIPVGQPIARVYCTDAVEIAIPLSDTQLEWFDVPMGYADGNESVAGKGAKVDVLADFAGATHTWEGRVIRTRGQIDPISRMVHVVVEVEKPFELTESRPPLVPGMFVKIKIFGNKIEKVFRLPRYAIRNGSQVWIENEGKLEIVEVDIARLGREYVYIENGLNDGDVVIVSPLDIVTNGMNIRVNMLGVN